MATFEGNKMNFVEGVVKTPHLLDQLIGVLYN